MSVAAALLLLWVVSPLAGTIGYLEVAIPDRLFGFSGRYFRWGLRVVGLDWRAVVTAPGFKWLYTPLHRRLLGDPQTLLDRMSEQPEQFRIAVVCIRAQGILFVIVSLSAAILGAVVLATG